MLNHQTDIKDTAEHQKAKKIMENTKNGWSQHSFIGEKKSLHTLLQFNELDGKKGRASLTSQHSKGVLMSVNKEHKR